MFADFWQLRKAFLVSSVLVSIIPQSLWFFLQLRETAEASQLLRLGNFKDLSYISERILAMSFPAQDLEAWPDNARIFFFRSAGAP